MGLFSKLFKEPEGDLEKSEANRQKMRALFNHVVENGDDYNLVYGYTEDVSRFNYGFVHGSKTKIHKAYRNKYPTDAFIIYPDRKGYIGINIYDWLDDEKLYVYVSQEEAVKAFTDFFLNRFQTK